MYSSFDTSKLVTLLYVPVFIVFSDENAKGVVKIDIKCGAPFEPVNVYKMLQAIDFEAFKVRNLMCYMIAYHCKPSVCLPLLFCIVYF